MISQLASSALNPLLRRPSVQQLTGKSRVTLYRDMKKGLLTNSVQIGGNRVAWPQNEIIAINQARISGKSDNEIKQLVKELHAARVA